MDQFLNLLLSFHFFLGGRIRLIHRDGPFHVLRVSDELQIVTKCRHSSMDLSAPTILPPWVRVPSTPSTLLSIIVFVQCLSCEKNKNKQKEAGFGTFKKHNDVTFNVYEWGNLFS